METSYHQQQQQHWHRRLQLASAVNGATAADPLQHLDKRSTTASRNMASSSSGASSSSTTPSPSGSTGMGGNGKSGGQKTRGSTDQIPSTALIANASSIGLDKENDLTSSNEVDTEDDLNNISSSLSSAWVDEIRFSSYRLAAKLRLLQQRTGLVLLDVWNVIEAFRENGLSNTTADIDMTISKAKLEALLTSMYGALAKRLPPPNSYSNTNGHQGAGTTTKDLQAMASWLFNWLFNALKPAGSSNIKVRTLKTAMSTLCSGKLLDKLRYLFSQLADNNGHMIAERFTAFIRDVGRIASAVGEDRQPIDGNIFKTKAVTVNDFIETLMSDPGPACLSWLPLLHRIANAESVVHYGLRCSSCRTENFRGLKYKSDNYQLCQACFWCGHIDSEHKNDVFKEYNSHKTSGGSGGRSTTPSSLKKSITCIQGSSHHINGSSNGASVASGRKTPNSNGDRSDSRLKKRPVPQPPVQEPQQQQQQHPEKAMDLSSMVPPTSMSSGTLWSHPGSSNVGLDRGSSGNFNPHPFNTTRLESNAGSGSVVTTNPISDQHYFGVGDYESSNAADPYMAYPEDEHELIAAYAQQLANAPDAKNMEAMSSHSRNLVRELERKNREIMRDIHHLKRAHRNQRIMQMPPGEDPSIVTELEDLRNHKAGLEVRLDELQTARGDLMSELEELMKLLKMNDQIYPNPGPNPNVPPTRGSGVMGPGGLPRPGSRGGSRPGSGMNNSQGPVMIMSNYDQDVTDVSGLNIERLHHSRPASSQGRGVIANEGSINSASD